MCNELADNENPLPFLLLRVGLMLLTSHAPTQQTNAGTLVCGGGNGCVTAAMLL